MWVDEAEVSQEEEKNACGNRIDVRRLKIGSYQVIVTPRDILPDEKMLQLVPLCIVAGIGCKKGTSSDKIERCGAGCSLRKQACGWKRYVRWRALI